QALAQNPNDETWRRLRDQCAVPPPTSSVPAMTTVLPAPTVAERLDEAEKQITAKDCQTALAAIADVLSADTTNERARNLSAKATACVTVASMTTTVPAEVLQPSKGGLPTLRGESEKDHKTRAARVKQSYDEAVALLESRKYLQARKAFDDLARQ